MTYCVGLMLDEGFVLLSDTRTNAGMDNIASYRKMYVYEEPGEMVLALMAAGSLSVTQTVIAKLEEAMHAENASPDTSILQADSLLKVAEIIGNLLSVVHTDISKKLGADNSAAATATFILAGQRKGGEPRMFLLYQEGNFIEAGDDTPFFQIGEHKYGKPLIDRVIMPSTSLKDGEKAVLLSMDSTLRSNLSVGMPLDLVVIKKDEYKVHEQRRIEADDEKFRRMSEEWSEALRMSFRKMPI